MKTITIEQLREKLHSDSRIEFTFVKKDGSDRNAIGTLNENLIPLEHHIVEDPSTNSKKVSPNFRYYDLEKNGWRSISKDTKEVKIN